MELRDGITIFGDNTCTLDTNGFGIVQKKINVQRQLRHKIEHADFFVDSPGLGYESATFYVTPQPIIYTDMTTTGLFLSPDNGIVPAYNENILFKAKLQGEFSRFGGQLDEFPNTFLAARPTFNFYSDTMYLTIFFNGAPGSVISDFMCSFYAALDTIPIDSIEHGIGLLREQSQMLISRLDVLGRSIPPSRNAGQIAPFWEYGGARPERMIMGETLTNFWLNMADRDDEIMTDAPGLRQKVGAARRMVGNPEAFGGGISASAVPDWIRLYLNEGIVSGPLRAQWPPLKHDDNGNVLCL
jgi:hypothetical protein